MGYMSIPHAKEFELRASVYLGPHVRKLVDTEIINELKSFTGHSEQIPESEIKARIKELERGIAR